MPKEATVITINDLIRAASLLAGAGNGEYNRALVELVGSFLPGDGDNVKAYLEPLIVPSAAAL